MNVSGSYKLRSYIEGASDITHWIPPVSYRYTDNMIWLQSLQIGSSSWNELTVTYDNNQSEVTSTADLFAVPRPPSAATPPPTPATEHKLKEEKKLPGVVMASLGKKVFNLLHQLADIDDNRWGFVLL